MSGWVDKCINKWLRITLQSAFINSILILLNAYLNFSLSRHLKLNLYEHEVHPCWFLISFSDNDTVPLFLPTVPFTGPLMDSFSQWYFFACLFVFFSYLLCIKHSSGTKGGQCSRSAVNSGILYESSLLVTWATPCRVLKTMVRNQRLF